MKIDLKTLMIGLLLGICVMLVLAPAKAEPPNKPDADYRFQISAVTEGSGTTYLYILDHETKKVFKRQYWNNGQGGFDVKRAITEGH